MFDSCDKGNLFFMKIIEIKNTWHKLNILSVLFLLLSFSCLVNNSFIIKNNFSIINSASFTFIFGKNKLCKQYSMKQ